MKEKIMELAKLLEDLHFDDELRDMDNEFCSIYCCDEVTGSLIHKKMDEILKEIEK